MEPRKGGPSPIFVRNVVILACAVDAADKQLLPATFKAMDGQLLIGPSGLAAMTFAQSIAFSLALPVWGSLMRYHSAQTLMVCGCLLWGVTTFALAMASSFYAQVALRVLVGAALASVNPLGQAIICDVVQEHERGHAFGLLGGAAAAVSMLVSFGATAVSSQVYFGVMGWRWAHAAVAFFSILTGLLLHSLGHSGSQPPHAGKETTWFEEQHRVLRAVGSRPTFYMMVAQGVTGGVPWNAFAFLTFYFQLSGYSDMQAGQLMLLGGVASVFGAILGGKLGDYFSSPAVSPTYGRCMVAQTSVVLGIVFFLWMIYVPYGAGSFGMVALPMMLFHASAGWTPAAALRPMCGELFLNPQDRAQILALWIALEGIISSFCGAPLASALAQGFGYHYVEGGPSIPEDPQLRAASVLALRKALVGVSLIPWILCALAWCPMYFTYPRDKQLAREGEVAKPVDSRRETYQPVAQVIGPQAKSAADRR